MGIAEQLAPKLKRTPSGIFVGSILVSGEVELGFQQVSELLTYPGIDYVGPLPGDLQKVTIFAGGIATQSKHPEAAKAWVKLLTSPAGAEAFKRRGMQPG
jgi:molybdate transport system substrate-binding protein